MSWLLVSTTLAAPFEYADWKLTGTPRACFDNAAVGNQGGVELWPVSIESRDPAVAGEPREIWYAISDQMPSDAAADVRVAALQWSNELGSAVHEGVDMRLVEKPWDPTVMGMCELNEARGFENYADLLFFWYTPGTQFACQGETAVVDVIRQLDWTNRIATTTSGALEIDTVAETCFARNIGIVLNANELWTTGGEGLPQYTVTGTHASVQHAVAHELGHAILGIRHLTDDTVDPASGATIVGSRTRYEGLLALAAFANDTRDTCPDVDVQDPEYKRMALMFGGYPAGGDPGGTGSEDKSSGSTKLDPHLFSCLQEEYADDAGAAFTNYMLYRWKPMGTPPGALEPEEAWNSVATTTYQRWIADANLIVTAEGSNLEPIVAAKVSDVPGDTDVKVRWYLTGGGKECRQGYPLMHPDRDALTNVGETELTLGTKLRRFGVVPDDFATCGVPPGKYILCAVIDPDCEVLESDETDNEVYSEARFLVEASGSECVITSGYQGPMLDVAAGENCGIAYASADNPLWDTSDDAQDCIADNTPPECDTSIAPYSMADVGTLEGYTEGRPHQYQSTTLANITNGDGAADAVVEFTAPAADDYVFDTHGSNFDAGLWVTSALTGGTETDIAAAGRDRGIVGAQLVLNLAQDEVVYLVVDGDPRGAYNAPFRSAGDFDLNVAELQTTEGNCNDGRDLDDDGLIDCADGDCWLDAWCVETCDNGYDDNGDGRIDCVDPICGSDPGCVSSCPAYAPASAASVTINGTTAGEIDSYQGSCSFDYGNSETTIEFTAPLWATYVFDTVGTTPGSVGDLYLLDGCTGAELECGGQLSTSVDGSWRQITRTLQTGETVVLVVDDVVNDTFTVNIDISGNTETECTDGRDIDDDGYADCLDDDCATDPACIEICDDDVDNDLDGDFDCWDSDCSADAACWEDCADGIDNDGDTLIDCDDVDSCSTQQPCDPFEAHLTMTAVPAHVSDLHGQTDDYTCSCVTTAGFNDLAVEFTAPADGTYLFDLVDQDAPPLPHLQRRPAICLLDDLGGTEHTCSKVGGGHGSQTTLAMTAGQVVAIVADANSADDEGAVQLNITQLELNESDCDDLRDGDADGAADCSDPGSCSDDNVCNETICNNGIDDDNDQMTDCVDPSCLVPGTGCEVCDDGADNDGDGSTDCDDLDCRLNVACYETQCSDGIDNDNDGATDCCDANCGSYIGCILFPPAPGTC
ncbi:MAG: hypothetical protein KTR31_31780 [Myxococcales bacterium]|nr:hypothetical protein [Myxococcales bacterium]